MFIVVIHVLRGPILGGFYPLFFLFLLHSTKGRGGREKSYGHQKRKEKALEPWGSLEETIVLILMVFAMVFIIFLLRFLFFKKVRTLHKSKIKFFLKKCP